jgi:hypothetical protein
MHIATLFFGQREIFPKETQNSMIASKFETGLIYAWRRVRSDEGLCVLRSRRHCARGFVAIIELSTLVTQK